jgi:hypothetical protein
MVIILFIGTKLLVLDCLPRQQKFNQDHFRAMISLELSKENPKAKRRVGKNPLIVYVDNSMGDNVRKIREYFARQTMMRIPPPVCSRDLSPITLVLRLCKGPNEKSNQHERGRAGRQVGRRRDIVRGDSLNQCSTSDCQDRNRTEHEGEHSINLHRLDRNRIYSSPEQ